MHPAPVVYQAESRAIDEAVKSLLEQRPRSKKIAILSDSAFCLRSLTHFRPSTESIKDRPVSEGSVSAGEKDSACAGPSLTQRRPDETC